MTGVEVLVNLSSAKFNKGYWYSVPEKFESEAEQGKRVLVQIGKLIHEGYIAAIDQNCLKVGLKPIIKVLDEEPVLDQRLLKLARWMAEYYVCPVSSVLKVMIPRLLTKKKSCVIIPAISHEEFNNIHFKSYINMKLMKYLWANGKISFTNALKYATKDELKDMETHGLIFNRGLYKVKQHFKAGHVYTIQKFDYNQDMPVLKKRAYRQAEIMELVLRDGYINCEDLDRCYARTTINSLINKGYLKIAKKAVQHVDRNLQLTQEQKEALDIINNKIKAGHYEEILLFGVTGSGKTEVYIEAAEQTIKQGKSVIILVPEIALTRHLVSSFNTRFKNMAVLHSAMSPGERYEEWTRIKNGEINLVLGTRSAIFAPLPAIGLIVIDEEQETTYKQEETPRYHARDVAAHRAQMDSAVLLAGSATPSVESFYKAMNGSMTLVTLQERIGDAKLPKVVVENLRKSFCYGERKIISPYLQGKISEAINRGEQTILFINRRGYAPITICMECGNIVSCPDCSVALTYHQDINQNVCHYCNYRTDIPCLCETCGSNHIQQIGFGTQKLEEEVHSLFPQARISRLDRDTSMRKGAQNNILDNMKKHKIDILIGTQMVAKGLDFPAVSLVGVVDADGMLNIPDFRAAERCFQLIVQAAGRAGRGDFPGEVIIQSYNPENPVIQMAAQQDYFSFYQKEIKFRKLLHYPPFTNLLRVVINSSSETETRETCCQIAEYINDIIDAREEDIYILGPAPCPISKIRNRYRYQVLVKCDNLLLISSIAKYIIYRGSNNTRIEVDINPLITM